MALTQAVLGRTKAGDKFITYGSWAATAVTGGDIKTGLKTVDMFVLQHSGSAVEAAVGVVNETFPLASGDVTFVCTSGDTGYWFAIGR